jgi:S-adenosyl methyltransferase
MAGDTQVPSGIDPSVATAARIYDYLLGGHENFAADRIAALKVIEAAPEAPVLAKETASSSAAPSSSWLVRPELISSWTWEPACPRAGTSTRSPSK